MEQLHDTVTALESAAAQVLESQRPKVETDESGEGGWKTEFWKGRLKMEIVTSLVTSSDTLWACLVFCSDFSCDIRISWGKQWHKLPPLRSSAPSARWLENPPAGKINCKCGIVYCHV